MGGGASRLLDSDSPVPPLDPDFCQAKTSDPLELLRRCEEALGDGPPRFCRSFTSVDGADGVSGDDGARGPIRVMQWNILAQALGEGLDHFVRCPPEALSWSRRKFLIVEEIVRYRPHIVCLQEVDHYHDTLQPVLARLGFAGHFCPKPWSPCLDVEGNNGPDGCALFFDRTRYDVLDSVGVRLSAAKAPTNQVAVVTMLRCRRSGRRVCAAATHLKARSGWEWLRGAQGADLLRQVHGLIQKHAPDPPGVPLLICGDFNAAPGEDVYHRFSSSPLGLDSAYKQLRGGVQAEPDFTTWKIRRGGESRGTLDYIWYSRSTLRVDAVLQLPTKDQIGPGRLPSLRYPSDHLSLVCDFSFTQP